MDPFGVVADDDEDLGRSVGPDAERLDELRGGLEDEFLNYRLQLRCLSIQSDLTSGEGSECVSVAVVRGFTPGWPQ